MSVSAAATLQCLGFATNPMGGVQRGGGPDPQSGVLSGS